MSVIRTCVKNSIRPAKTLLALQSLLVLLTCITPAHAFERIVPDSPAFVLRVRPTALPENDACLARLDENTSYSAQNDNIRANTQTAALGLILGLRFALGPRQGAENRPHLAVWQPGNTGDAHAIAVANYRRCRSEEALKAWNNN